MPKHRGQNVTLKDIAQRVGVSAMTVSRALSGKAGLVNPDTVRHIREVAEMLGYTPNLMARSLRGEQLPTIVVFAEFISSHHYLAELVDLVARSIENRGFSVIACQSSHSLLAAVKQFKLAGAVILAPPEALFFDDHGRPETALRMDEPAVVIHSAVEQPFLNEVTPDLVDAAYQAARHLVELGHRTLGFLGGPPLEDEPLWFGKRRTGIEKALATAGLGLERLKYQACPNADVAPAALQQLLRNEPGITGLICLNDEIALAAIHGARCIQLDVPRDLSVIGSNDIRLARFYRPALTTLAIDVPALVETGLNVLFEEIRHRRGSGLQRQPVKVAQRCELIIRGSTAKPRSA